MSYTLVFLVLRFLPVSVTLPSMNSLLKTGSGMILAYADRGRPGGDEKRFLINFYAVKGIAGWRGGLDEPARRTEGRRMCTALVYLLLAARIDPEFKWS